MNFVFHKFELAISDYSSAPYNLSVLLKLNSWQLLLSWLYVSVQPRTVKHFLLVSYSEKRRLQDAFRLSSSASSTLSRNVFTAAVLGECVPITITEQVFNLVGGSRGVTFRELLTLLVLVTRGTREEKFKCKPT